MEEPSFISGLPGFIAWLFHRAVENSPKLEVLLAEASSHPGLLEINSL